MATWDQFNPKLPKDLVPTELGKKYGVPIHDELFKAGKSGLTPLPPLEPFSSRQYSDIEQLEIDKRHGYQRAHLEGFTASELQDLGCVNATDAKPSTIDGFSLHPLYHRDNWLNSAQDGLVGHTVSGLWQAKNDHVWNVLLPCLKLASAFLASKSSLPWFDALTCGERKLVTENTPWAPLYTFYKRPPREAQEEIDAGTYQGADHLIMSPAITRKIKFCLSKTLQKGTQGRTATLQAAKPTETYPGIIEISLSTHLIGPLLRTDLTTSERLATQFKAAKTILHETSHALQNLVNEYVTKEMNPSEPFFENDRIAEIGYAMERALFEGNLSVLGLLIRRDITAVPPDVTAWGIPVMGMTMNTYPNWAKADTLKKTMIPRNERLTRLKKAHKTHFYNLTDFDDDPAAGKKVCYTTWPIPILWLSKFHSLDFWSCTRSTGHQHFRIPRIIGKRKSRTHEKITAGPTFLKYIGFVPEGMDIEETASGEAALNDEETIKGYAVRTILRNRADFEQIQNWTRKPKGFARFVVRAGSLPKSAAAESGSGEGISTAAASMNTAPVQASSLNTDTTTHIIGQYPGPSPQNALDNSFYKREFLPVVVDSGGDVVMGGTSPPSSPHTSPLGSGNEPANGPKTPGSITGRRGSKRGASTTDDETLEFENWGHSVKKKKGGDGVGTETGTGNVELESRSDIGVGMSTIRSVARGKGTTRGTTRGRGASSLGPRGGVARGGMIRGRGASNLRPRSGTVARGGRKSIPRGGSTLGKAGEPTIPQARFSLPSSSITAISRAETPSGRGSQSMVRGTPSNRRTTSTIRSTPYSGRGFSIPRAGLSHSTRGRGNFGNRGAPSENRGRGTVRGRGTNPPSASRGVSSKTDPEMN